MKKKLFPLLLLLCLLVFSGCTAETYVQTADGIPAFSGSPYVVVEDNIPDFSAGEETTRSFETYSELDALGRCGAATACIGTDIMPTEERGSIGQVKPTGWQTAKYDCVDGKYLYNRCHLIGYQLTGENANKQNLITGTRYLNVEGMLPFENMVADFVKETGIHVLYRVTPVFEGNDLVASGVFMEAKSMEDNGDGIQFHVYCYNVQPGVEIDYATGDSHLEGSTQSGGSAEQTVFVLNTNTKKFHKPDCSSAAKMKAEYRQESTDSREALIQMGYAPCGSCKP